jgi:hypothetical protein
VVWLNHKPGNFGFGVLWFLLMYAEEAYVCVCESKAHILFLTKTPCPIIDIYTAVPTGKNMLPLLRKNIVYGKI